MRNFIFGALLGTSISYFLFLDSSNEGSNPTISKKVNALDLHKNTQTHAPSKSQSKTETIVVTKETVKQEEVNCEKPSPVVIEKMIRKKFAGLSSKERLMWIKGIDPNNPHPGTISEEPPGTVLEDGSLAGEAEASLFIEHFEKDLYDKLQAMDVDELRDKYANDLHWFQRVGNFRKSQKCRAIHNMQKDFNLEVTSFDDCASNIMQTEKETWGDWQRHSKDHAG